MSQLPSFLGHIETGFMEHLNSIMTYFKVKLHIQQDITKNVDLTKSTTFDYNEKEMQAYFYVLWNMFYVIHFVIHSKTMLLFFLHLFDP